MTTLQERRHQAILAQITREGERRENLIGLLARSDAKLRRLKRRAADYERRAARPTPAPKPKPAAPPAPTPTVTVKVAPGQSLAGAMADIPDFLDRVRNGLEAGRRKDQEARAKIEAEQAERKRTKKKVQDEKRAAKRTGDTRRMPPSGKAALAAIRG